MNERERWPQEVSQYKRYMTINVLIRVPMICTFLTYTTLYAVHDRVVCYAIIAFLSCLRASLMISLPRESTSSLAQQFHALGSHEACWFACTVADAKPYATPTLAIGIYSFLWLALLFRVCRDMNYETHHQPFYGIQSEKLNELVTTFAFVMDVIFFGTSLHTLSLVHYKPHKIIILFGMTMHMIPLLMSRSMLSSSTLKHKRIFYLETALYICGMVALMRMQINETMFVASVSYHCAVVFFYALLGTSIIRFVILLDELLS